MLERVTHIEGLDTHEDFELFDDIHPDGMMVKFFVVAEEMPWLTENTGSVVTKNFIHVRVEKHLGQTVFCMRINDKVDYDENEKKWKIKRLYPGMHGNYPHSHIKRWPEAWNRFMSGLNDTIVGTSLSLIFKSDPSRAEYYKTLGIQTIEHLALQEGNCENMVSGAKDDVKKAQNYLKKVKEQAPALELAGKLAEKDRAIANQQTQINELNAKLNQILEDQLKPKLKGGRPRKDETDLEAI